MPGRLGRASIGVMLTVLSFGLVPQSASVRLDPLTLIASKGAQTSTRRPYCPPAQNSALAALPGVHRTRVGYCGGETPDPTYRKVCASGNKDSLHPGEAAAGPNGYAQYAETIQLEFDEAQLSYADVLDAFFRAHDAERRGKSRQYQSVIFVHSAEQRTAALEALNVRPNCHTQLEVAPDFWDAEPYHQKWPLQRKRDLFLALGMSSEAELLGPLPSVLNAFAAGKLRADVAAERMAGYGASEEVLAAIFGELQ
eukprot:scaffold28654_cov70-Phaeocystis_antarctica.AAC.5